jgi:hypothetical protein
LPGRRLKRESDDSGGRRRPRRSSDWVSARAGRTKPFPRPRSRSPTSRRRLSNSS